MSLGFSDRNRSSKNQVHHRGTEATERKNQFRDTGALDTWMATGLRSLRHLLLILRVEGYLRLCGDDTILDRQEIG
jgi:hypothetical protein